MLSPEYVTLATSVSPVVRVYWARTEVEPFTFRKDPYWTQGVEFNSRHFSTIWSCGKLRSCSISQSRKKSQSKTQFFEYADTPISKRRVKPKKIQSRLRNLQILRNRLHDPLHVHGCLQRNGLHRCALPKPARGAGERPPAQKA